MADEVLLFVTYKPKEKALAELTELFSSRTTKPLDLDAAAEMLRKHLDLKFKPALRGMPSYDFVLALDGVDQTRRLTIDDTFVFALDAIDRREAEQLVRTPRENSLVYDVHVAIDLPTGLADAEVWCPQEASFPLFGDLDLALMQMRAAAAANRGAYGKDVNVVIIDQGINKDVLGKRFSGAKFVGGWATPEFGKGGPLGPYNLIPPGAWPDDGLGPRVTHGTKMASLVLAVAPQANIIDIAMLPSHILDLGSFLSWALAVYLELLVQIPLIQKLNTAYSGPWVLNNSWAVYDLSQDIFPPFYGSDPGHLLNQVVALLPSLGIADVVFAAGNCGQFCPDPRCGAAQVGPARSIYGVAALKDVLTVAAVRSDEIWLGYSSQGPSGPNFASTKPDLCAPSQFAAADDWDRSFTGTSTACALTTGAIAAKRSLVSPSVLSPPALRAYAVAKARLVVNQTTADDRHGAGMIDVDNFV
jgi:subtilase family protein